MKFKIELFALALCALSVVACTQTRLRRYGELLDPLVGGESKAKVATILGAPSRCESYDGGQRCEYRTAAGRNTASIGVLAPNPAMGPNLAPYEHFDVINVYFNNVGLMREWEPIVLPE
jgi:hypothetical protein